MAKKCCICGKNIGMFEKNYFFNTPEVPKGMKLWICSECIKIKGKAIFLPDGRVKIQKPDGSIKETASSGYKKRCNVCGKIICYNLKDIEDNERHAKSAALSAVGGIAGALSGNYAAGATSNQAAADEANRIIDYTKCPSCGSRDLVDITDEDIAKINSQQNGEPTISSADELKKFKELLDSGVITQEEFDQKKKQLLGL